MKTIGAGDPRSLPAQQALEMATITGARAIGMADRIGSLEAGKRADIVSVRLDAPHAVPMYNVYSQLVYALKASDVADVMVNGRVIVRDKKMMTIDPAPVMAKAAEYQEKVKKSLAR